MNIRERATNHATVLDVEGDITYATRATFKTAIEKARYAGFRHVIVNMEQVRFVDSSGLGLLALVAQAFRTAQGKFSLLNPQPYVREIMNLANIHTMIPIYSREEDALAGRTEPALS
jgi:anti-anti-sigma factor